MTINETVMAFLNKRLALTGAEHDLSADEPLLGRGVLDSIGMLQLIAHLEERYDLALADADFDPANFETVASIAAFLRARGISDEPAP